LTFINRMFGLLFDPEPNRGNKKRSENKL
jgi:hypothetical protein